MNLRKALIAIASVAIMASCTPSEQQMVADIEQAKVIYQNDTTNNIALNKQLIQKYTDFLENYPESQQANDYRFELGEIYYFKKNSFGAISNFKYIYDNAPEYKNIEQVIMYLGFIYANQVCDFETAEMYFRTLIKKYPNSEYVKDAESSIKFLGKTPDEIIEILQNQTQIQDSIDSVAN